MLAHKGDPGRKGQMEFKVRWQGFTASNDTREPWKTLRNVPGLHAYLISVGLARLVPKLLYGNAINLDRGIFLPFDAISHRDSLSNFTQDMLNTQNRLLHEASKWQQAKRFAHLNNN